MILCSAAYSPGKNSNLNYISLLSLLEEVMLHLGYFSLHLNEITVQTLGVLSLGNLCLFGY